MATLEELRGLFNHHELLPKIEAALIKEAKILLDAATPTSAQKQWAAYVAGNPRIEAEKALMFVLAENSNATVSQIIGAGDTAIQSAVNSIVDVLVEVHSAGVV